MNEWQTVKLGEVGKIVTGKTPKTAIADNYGNNILFLTPSDDMTVKKCHITNKKLSEKGALEVENCVLPKNTVCVSCIGSDLGKVVLTTENTVTNQQINSIIPNESCYYDYLYYQMLILGRELNFISKTSTAVPIVNKTAFSNYSITLPPLPEQRAIAATLSCLDDKIELNNRINKTLEEMAQAIFKRWFVDFEFPNEDEQPYKSSGGAMQDSELGEIPQGWRIGTLDSCCNLITKGITPKYNEDSDELVINQRCIRDSKIDLSLARRHIPKTINEKWLVNGDVLINSTGEGTLGRVAQVNFEPQKLTADSHVTIIRPNAKLLISYLGAKLCGMQAIFEGMSSGSTGQTDLPRERLKNLSIVLPDERVLLLFSELYRPLREQIVHNQEQNQTLTTVRDTLLPKLMSGDIRVPIENRQ